MSIPFTIKSRLIQTYKEAASKGDAQAAYFISACYRTGFGVKADKEEVIKWAVKAAELGNLEAIKMTAERYEASDMSILFPWLLKAAESGHRASQLRVSRCYEFGF